MKASPSSLLWLGAALVAAASLWLPAAAQDDPCENLKDERGCLTGNCNWCYTVTVPSSCHNWDTAQRLPPTVFNCGNYSRTDCREATTNATCMTKVGCAWCHSRTVADSCSNALNASHLPPSVFQCAWAPGAFP